MALRVRIIRAGDFTMVFLPGEIFAEVGMKMERRIGGDALVVGYSNRAEAGYMPMAEQFALCACEAAGAPKYYDLFPYAPGVWFPRPSRRRST